MSKQAPAPARAEDDIDYYELFGLEPNATAEQIRHAYRAAAKRHHPDAGGTPEAMDLLNEAYAVLGDPLKRHEYDTERRLEAERRRAKIAPAPEAEMTYFDMTARMQAELFRQQADLLNAQRAAWARQSAATTLSNTLMWLCLSLVLGFLLRAELTRQLAWVWFLLNAGLLAATGFGITGILWPDLRLELLDLSFKRRLLPSRRWWKRTLIVICAATAISAAIVISALVMPS
ncbi:MAG TPA: J domain-containing protein [Candidatus Saccharimonadia bacterium]